MGRFVFPHRLFKTQAKTCGQQKANSTIERNAVTAAAIGCMITKIMEPVVPHPVIIDTVSVSVSISVNRPEIVGCSVKMRQIIKGPV